MSSVVLGAIGPAKANASRRCVVGNFLCIKAVATVGSVLKVDVGVYADDDDTNYGYTNIQKGGDDDLARDAGGRTMGE